MQEAPARLYGLDAMRGIAAICVLGLHVPAIYAGLPNLFGKAYLAVDFFFMLSGFLMARTYGARLANGRLSGWQFLHLRYRRLWPVMAVGGLIGAGYLWSATQDPWLFAALFIANLALLPVSFQQELYPLNVPAWSVFLELAANALHGLLLGRLTSRAIFAVALIALALTIWSASAAGSLDLGARPASLLSGFARAILSYAIGMLLFRRWKDRSPLALPPLIAAGSFPLLLALPRILGFDHWVFDLAFVLIASPLLLAGGLGMSRPATWAVWLGNASFPLYAVHFAVLRQAQLWEIGPVGAVMLVIALTVPVTLWAARPRRSGSASSSHLRVAFADSANQGQ